MKVILQHKYLFQAATPSDVQSEITEGDPEFHLGMQAKLMGTWHIDSYLSQSQFC